MQLSCRFSNDARRSLRFPVIIVDGPTMTTPSPGHCQRGEVPCDNGVCIPLDYLCDGDYDCTDRSDEANCGQFIHDVSKTFCLFFFQFNVLTKQYECRQDVWQLAVNMQDSPVQL